MKTKQLYKPIKLLRPLRNIPLVVVFFTGKRLFVLVCLSPPWSVYRCQ